MTENDIMRETLSCLTGFCSGSELSGPDDSEERHGYAWHADGWPDGFGDLALPSECSEADGWADRFTGIGHVLSTPKPVLGWTLVARIPCAECECPCVRWDGLTSAADPKCPLCEGDRFLYLGEETTMDLYARWNVERWASEAEEHTTVRDGRYFLSEDAPEWVREFFEAAGDACDHDVAGLDTQHRLFAGVLSAVSCGDSDPGTIADGCVSVYNAERSAWLAESLAHAGWVDDACAEGLCSDDADIFTRLGAGMYHQAYAVACAVLDALQTTRDDA